MGQTGEYDMRPQAVRSAEAIYLASIALTAVLAWLGWDEAVRFGGVALAFGINAVFVGLSLLLLILTTRRASRVALWMLVAFTALNLIGFAMQVERGALATGLFGVLTTVQAASTLVGIVLLFRPRAREWFARLAHAKEVQS
jgi:hypothetical protein